MREIPRGRVTGWSVLVLLLAVVGYAGRIAGGTPDRNLLYHYSTAVGGAIQFAIIGAVLLVLTRGLDSQGARLKRPESWGEGSVTPRSVWRDLARRAGAVTVS